MHLNQPKRLALILSFAYMCFAEITVKTSESDDSGIVKAAINILESCYGTHLTTLGLAGNLTGRISNILWSGRNVPATLIDATERVVNNVHPISQHKLQFFVVSVSSSTTLTRTLRQIQESIWWNHMANFLILEWPLSNDGCSNAFEMLWAAWEMNILKAKFLCYHRTKGRTIYTFNPYTIKAPDTWKIKETYSGKNDHPWTLFVRNYGDGEGVCNELDFEKANDLGGYPIFASVTEENFDTALMVVDGVGIGAMDRIGYEIIYPTLNATPKMLLHHSNESLGYIDEEGSAHGLLAEVVNGLSDISFRGRYLTSLKNTTSGYPLWESSLCIVTQHRGYKSQLSKLFSVIDSHSRYGLCLVFLITVVFFKYFLGQSVMEAYLSTIRIICNASIPKIPRKVAPRIYLGGLFLFALTMQGIYQGQLASLLTNEVYLRNPNTKRDLIELGYTIYSHKMYSSFFAEKEFDGRFVATDHLSCTDYVLSDPTAACVGDLTLILYDAAKFKLHVSTKPVEVLPVGFPIRKNWPLEERINTVYVRSIESHIFNLLYDKVTGKLLRTIEIGKSENEGQGARVLSLKKLEFAFAILGIGLGCATVSIIIEVGIGGSSSRIFNNMKTHIRNRSENSRETVNKNGSP